MEFKGFEEKAETPEIGGFFDNLILICKPNLQIEQFKRREKYIKSKWSEVDKRELAVIDEAKIAKDALTIIADHIMGWKNLTRDNAELPFNQVNRNHFFFNLRDKLTGHKLELPKIDGDGKEERTATLEEYIRWFIGEMDNFLKN